MRAWSSLPIGWLPHDQRGPIAVPICKRLIASACSSIGTLFMQTARAMIVGDDNPGAKPMATFDRITCVPTILNGQPTIRGMRLSVRRVIKALAVYPNWDDLRREYPELEPEDIRQALEFAARNLDDSVQPLETV
jgi:uncharacterized protein (DUF433 family)